MASLVIAAYNCERTIRAAVQSCLAQDYSPLEVIVVDDGSTDSTPDILAGFGDRVRVVRQVNSGLAAARNAGILASSGEYVALMDGDDVCRQERLRVQVEVLERFPDVAVCGSSFSAFDDAGAVSASHGSRYYSQLRDQAIESIYPLHGAVGGPQPTTVHRGDVHEALLFGNFIHPPTVMFRRRAYDAAGRFDEGLRYTADWEWLVRVAKVGRAAHVDRVLLDYRLSSTQMSSSAVNAGRGAAEIAKTVERLWTLHPEIRARSSDRVDAFHREVWLDAAYGLARTHKTMALRMLAKAARSDPLDGKVFTVALRILTPDGLRELLSRARARFGTWVLATGAMCEENATWSVLYALAPMVS